jgi:protein-tyrosine phosphatase
LLIDSNRVSRGDLSMADTELGGAWNVRDVAASTGTGDWPALRPGKLLRSSMLSRLDDDGREILRQLGISDVADLRSPKEVRKQGPGKVPDGAVVHLLPFPDIPAVGDDAPHENAFKKMLKDRRDGESIDDAATRYMTEEYARFPRLGGAKRAVKRVISLLAEERPVIAHCFAGKDRTGFTVSIVLGSLGFGFDAILADYLRSNNAISDLKVHMLELIEDRDDHLPEGVSWTEARLTDAVLGVQQQYLEATRRTIKDVYGGLDGFLRAADVPEADVEKMGSAVLV